MNHHTNKLLQFIREISPVPKVPALGERELEVMKVFWQSEELSAKEVLQRVADNELSLSTMQSTLERLYRKKLLHRKKLGRFFVYKAAVSRVQIISQLLGDIAEQFCDGDMAPLVSGFTNFYSENTCNLESDNQTENISQFSHFSDDEFTD